MKKIYFQLTFFCLMAFNAVSQNTIIKGLTVMVDFQGAPFNNPIDSVSKMMNQSGFTGWGNIGSLRDYFLTQTNGKVDVSTTVIKVSIPHTRAYYYDDRLGNEVTDIVAAINAAYPTGFQNLTLDANGALVQFSILTKLGGGAWAFGAQGNGLLQIKNNGQNVFVHKGNITHYSPGDNPEYNTVCHEMGHSLFDWTDYYSTPWSNLGNYCLMASAGDRIGPMPVSPALRLKNGWITNVINVGTSTTNQTYTAVSNSYSTIFKYTNPSNPKEYILIHPQVYGGYYKQKLNNVDAADQGLALYYVDEDGGMDKAGLEPAGWKIRLIQADNIDEMHMEYLHQLGRGADVRGDLDDLYDNVKNSFPNGTPFRWKNGGEFGLNITNISAPGASMTFTVLGTSNKFVTTSDNNGKTNPWGVFNAANGTSRTFTFEPNPGYEINQVTVNGTVTTVSNNTLTVSALGTKNIHVSYKRKATLDAMPSPWNHVDIGSAPTSGVSGHSSGKFFVESYGDDIWNSSDNFRYIYRSITGDGSIMAKVTYVNKLQGWAKSGIMIRESLSTNSVHSSILMTPQNNYIRSQKRLTTGGNSVDADKLGNLHHYILYNWFRVTRTGNNIKSEISYDKVNWVTLDEEVIPMSNQVYVGMVTSGATADGSSKAWFDSVTVVNNSTATDFCIEAESALGQSTFAPYQVVNNANASGGKYIVAPNGTGNQSSPPSTSIATYSFNVPATATYNFWVRILAPTSNDNNMYIRTDASSYSSWTPGTSTSWTWKKWTSKSMTAGVHTISLARNKDGMQIDKIFITKSSSTPSGLGCSSSAREESLDEISNSDMEEFNENSLFLSPNPSSHTFTVASADRGIAYLSVNNAMGVAVFNSVNITKGSRVEFGTDFEPGMYTVHIRYEDGKTESLKVIKTE